jgi:hypothetical protein
MDVRLRQAGLALIAASAWALAAPAAHAFTMQGPDASEYQLPKFDLEEQSRNFRTDGADGVAAAQDRFEMPLGAGTLQFGVQQGPSSNFMMPGSSLGSSPRNTREDFNRVVTPQNMR